MERHSHWNSLGKKTGKTIWGRIKKREVPKNNPRQRQMNEIRVKTHDKRSILGLQGPEGERRPALDKKRKPES